MTYGGVFPQTILLRKQVSKTLSSTKHLDPLSVLGLPTVKPIQSGKTPRRNKPKKNRKRKQKDTQEHRDRKKKKEEKQDDTNKQFIFNPAQYVRTDKCKRFNAVFSNRRIQVPIFFDTLQKREVYFPFGFGLCIPVPIVKGG